MGSEAFFDEIDPDLNYYHYLHDNNGSPYETVEEYNRICRKNTNCFTILNFNIRSYNSNSSKFLSLFECNLSLPHVMVICETWFNPQNSRNIHGYKSHHVFRNSNSGHGGGISVFVKDSYASSLVPNFSYASETIEIVTVEVSLDSGSEILVVGIYRPHSDTPENFNCVISEVLDTLQTRGKQCFIIGDLNINLILDLPSVNSFNTIMQSHHFIPCITKPTRFLNNSQNPSLLDHIWCNKIQNYKSGIILTDCTDHCPTYFQIQTSQNKDSNLVKISFRIQSESNVNKFKETLDGFDWSLVGGSDLHSETENFVQKLNALYRSCFPLKIKYVKNTTSVNPWMTSSLLKLVQAKSKYFNLFRLGLVSCEENRIFRNKVNSLVSKSKKSYYKNLFN